MYPEVTIPESPFRIHKYIDQDKVVHIYVHLGKIDFFNASIKAIIFQKSRFTSMISDVNLAVHQKNSLQTRICTVFIVTLDVQIGQGVYDVHFMTRILLF